jgi:transposase-like protein
MDTTDLDRGELAAHYARILAEQERTGASMREVAGNQGVTPATLYAWRRRLRERGEAPVGLIAVDVMGGATPQEPSAQYEIALPSGVKIRAPRDFDAFRVRELLEAVRAC